MFLENHREIDDELLAIPTPRRIAMQAPHVGSLRSKSAGSSHFLSRTYLGPGCRFWARGVCGFAHHLTLFYFACRLSSPPANWLKPLIDRDIAILHLRAPPVPCIGQMYIGYIPPSRAVGLSKFAGIAEMFAQTPRARNEAGRCGCRG